MMPMAVERKQHLDAIAVATLLACCLFWGFQQVLAKATLPEIPPVWQASLRFVGATALLWAWCGWRGVKLFEADGTLVPGLVAGLLFAIEFALLFLGLQDTSASRLTTFLYTSPFWVAAIVPLVVAAERMRTMQWVGLACAFAAVVFALGESRTAGAGTIWRGDLLGLAAGAAWGLTTVVIRATRLARISPEKLLFYQVAPSALLLPMLSWALGEPQPLQFSAFGWTSLLVQTLVGSFASYLAWMWLLGRYPATKVSAFVFLTPIFALVFGTLWLKEPVTSGLLVALALVAVGIVLVSRR
jgi:drug/metabolite transporter (DMT)-like permease